MKLKIEDTTPCVQIKNEDFWIYYILRDIYKLFNEIIVLDTGSDDLTKDIIKKYYPNVRLIEEDYGNDAHKIGNGRNVLRQECKTHWMFIIDGDELWRTVNLLKIFDNEAPDNTEVVMLGLANVEDVDGRLKLRLFDYSNRDGLFAPDIKWIRTDYPFESYGLSGTFSMDGVHYINAHEVYAYHLRHTIRSSKNNNAFFRDHKYNYFPYNRDYIDLPTDWIGEINPEISNPYLSERRF